MPTLGEALVASKPSFDTALVTEHLGDQYHRLAKPLVYQSGLVEDKIWVPKGFVTDFASVPRLPVVYWIAGGRADKAACVHDYLYRFKLHLGRAKADRIFYEAMREAGYNWAFANNNYYWVRAFGWRAYGQHEEILDPR